MRLLPFALSLSLAACGTSQPPDNGAAPPAAAKKTVKFIAFGDAGRANDNQNAVGAAMAQLCALKGCDFALELGDNFYDSGVSSVTDEQFQTKFELPYKDLNIPVYATLGNHDNSGSSLGEGAANNKGDYQVQYTTAEGSSGKWTLPARYHSFTAPSTLVAGEAPIAEFFCLDSNPMAATIPDLLNTKYNFITYANTQLQWFQAGLAASKAKWTFAFAHHPYVSNGQHGNAGSFDGTNVLVPGTVSGTQWKNFLDASICDTQYNGGLDMMLYGHDHDLQWLKPVSTCNSKTEFILSGGGSDTREFGDATLNASYWQQDLTPGFFWFEVSESELTGEAYTLENLALPLDAAGKPKPAYVKSLSK